MPGIAVTTRGDRKLQRKLGRFVRKVKTPRPMFRRIGIQLLNEVSKTFKDETHEGEKWKPLSPVTVLMRRKGPGKGIPKILQDTGTMRRSFVIKATNKYISIGSPIQYSSYHEKGTGKIPKRQMLPSKQRGMEIAVKTGQRYIEDEKKKVGL